MNSHGVLLETQHRLAEQNRKLRDRELAQRMEIRSLKSAQAGKSTGLATSIVSGLRNIFTPAGTGQNTGAEASAA